MNEGLTSSPQPTPAALNGVWAPPADRHPAAAYLARLASSGARSQAAGLKRIAQFLSGGRLDTRSLPWHEVRYQHAAAVRSWLAGTVAPATANTYLAALRGVMKECWRLGYIDGEAWQRIADVEPVRGQRMLTGRALDGGELKALFDNMADSDSLTARRDAAAMALMYSSGGIRRSELVALDLSDFDAESGRLVVRGKGNKERAVYLTNGAADALADWLAVRGDEPGPLLRTVMKDRATIGGRMSASTVAQLCRRRAEAAGVKAFSPHDLRRTSISDLLDLTGDLSLVSELAGHSNPATTRRYDRRPEARRQRAAQTLRVPFNRRPAPLTTKETRP